MFRYDYLLAVLLLAAPPALAQAPDAPLPEAPMQAPRAPQHAHRTFRERFGAANTTHDGRLTLDQAQAANMRGVAQHFTEMDADRKGYVTLQDVRAWHMAQRAARGGQQQPQQQQPEQQPPPPPQ